MTGTWISGRPEQKRNIRVGRCHSCNVGLSWAFKGKKLEEIRCPFCGGKLEQTTQLFKGKWYRQEQPQAASDSPQAAVQAPTQPQAPAKPLGVKDRYGTSLYKGDKVRELGGKYGTGTVLRADVHDKGTVVIIKLSGNRILALTPDKVEKL